MATGAAAAAAHVSQRSAVVFRPLLRAGNAHDGGAGPEKLALEKGGKPGLFA